MQTPCSQLLRAARAQRLHFMASIQRVTSALTGDVSYRVQVRVKGRPSESETFPNRREAELGFPRFA
jgi:hypothetical protein